jgi:hypothetical protein
MYNLLSISKGKTPLKDGIQTKRIHKVINKGIKEQIILKKKMSNGKQHFTAFHLFFKRKIQYSFVCLLYTFRHAETLLHL